AICDRDADNLASAAGEIAAGGRRVVQAAIDVRDGEAVRAFFAQLQAELGRVDVLVNNAGGGFMADFLEVSDKGQEALVRENFASVAHCIRAAVPLMAG